jgi:hypothetical protein
MSTKYEAPHCAISLSLLHHFQLAYTSVDGDRAHISSSTLDYEIIKYLLSQLFILAAFCLNSEVLYWNQAKNVLFCLFILEWALDKDFSEYTNQDNITISFL